MRINLKKLFLARFFSLTILIDIVAQFRFNERLDLLASSWSLLILMTTFLTLDITLYLSRKNIVLSRFVRISFSFIISLTIFCNLILIYYFKEFLTFEMLFYLKSDTSSLINIAQSYLLNFKGLSLFLLILIVCHFLIKNACSLNYRKSRYSILLLIPLFLAEYFSVNALTWNSSYSTTDFVSATLISIKRGISQIGKNNFLHRSVHITPQKEGRIQKYNFLIIYHESMGVNATELYQSEKILTPRLSQFFNKYRDTFVKFENAYTNSTATDLSVPIILTGLGPTDSIDKYHQIPFLWDWANSFNLETFFVTSQRFEWARFDKYFLASPPNHMLSAENSGHKVIHDIGIDDHYSARSLIHLLKKKETLSPFLAIFNTNGMHIPFQQESEFHRAPKDYSPYEKSSHIVDNATGEIFSYLEESSLLENTFIIITSDHGEREKPSHPPTRIYSPFEEYIKIPILIKVPPLWKKENQELYNNLQLNSRINISNLDLVPTLLDAFGIDYASPFNKDLAKVLEGKSLFSKIDPKRIIKISTTNDFRSWNKESFTLIKENLRFIYSTPLGPQIYDIAQDPTQLSPLRFTEISILPELENIIQKDNHLRRMYDK